MGRTRKLLGLAVVGALVTPPLAAAIARSRLPAEVDEASDELEAAAIFDGRRVHCTAPALRRGTAIAWYGGLDVDLREAALDPAGARLRVIALFGGARIVVPQGWRVEVNRVALFGGVDDETAGSGSGPSLVVDAVAAFGGVTITDRAPVDEGEADIVLAGPTEAGFARAEAEAELAAAEIAAAAGVVAEEEAELESAVDETVQAARAAARGERPSEGEAAVPAPTEPAGEERS